MLATKKTYFILLFDLLFALLCAIGIYHLIEKSALPFKFTFERNGLLVNELQTSSNVLVTSIDGYYINNQDELEVVLDGKAPGDKVQIEYFDQTKLNQTSVTLTKFYSTFYIITCAFLSFVFILIGLIVYLKKPDQNYALIFHWLCLGVAGIISLTWGNYNIGLFGAGKIARIGFHLSYTFAPVIFLQFAYSFPRKIEFLRKTALISAYSLAAFLSLAGSILFFAFHTNETQSYLEDYIFVFDLYRLHVILWILTSIVVFIHSFRRSVYKSEKQKLLWLILGFIIGPGSFVTLWAIPQVLSLHNLVPEELILIMMTAIPITFAIAILKYRLMDIEFVITRGFIYSFTLALLYSLYLLLIYIFSELTNTLMAPQNLVSVISFGVAALLFHPVRIRVERFIDKKFYGIKYDFRKAFKNIVEEIKDIHSVNLLADKIVQRINELIVVNKTGFFVCDSDEKVVSLLSSKGIETGLRKKFKTDNNLADLKKPAAHSEKIEPGFTLQNLGESFLDEFNIDIVFPIRTEEELFGLLALGSKQSGLKYAIEDIDLLESVASRTAATIDRIKLQENIIRNQLEMEKLDELNQMKSFFVSSVSHDLKTPLTSIKMFTEFLKESDNKEKQKKEEYLKIIEGETDRLTRLIDNVLDLTKIEKNLKEYQFREVNLNDILEEVFSIIEYQINMSGFKIDKHISDQNLKINADKDAVTRSIINLINNAIKFSGTSKTISVSTFKQKKQCCVEVKDFGVGMDEQEIKKIFEPYFTSKEKFKVKFQGTGLGLAIVKHTMDAHKGIVLVASEYGKGSSFTLKFPGLGDV